MKKWEIIIKNIEKGKTEDYIFVVLQEEGIKINKKDLQKNIRQVRRIKELVKQGKSGNEIQKILQHEEIGLRRQTLQGIIRNLKGIGKRERKKKNFICMDYVIVRRWYEDNYEKHWLEKTDRPVSEAYRAVEEYEFYEHTRYDEVRFVYWISSDTKDWNKRLCFRKLKSLILIIFENFERLKLDEVRDEFDNLLFEFSREEIEYRKLNFKILKKVVDTLNTKEVGILERKGII